MKYVPRSLMSLLVIMPIAGFAGLQLTSVYAQESRQSVQLPITLEADQHTELYARIEGFVAKVHVDIGDRVEKGQLLVTLEAPEMQADVQRRKQMVLQAQAHLGVAEGGVKTAKARLRQADSARDEQAALRQLRVSERDRYTLLVGRGAVQKEKLDEAEYAVMAVDAAVAKIEADVEAADADVRAAENEVEFARSGIEVAKAELAHATALDDLREVKSPFAGTVTFRGVDPGQLVIPGNGMEKPLLIIEAVDVLRGVMTVPADEASLIHIGDPVTLIGFDDASGVKGPKGELIVSRVSQSLDRKTRTMRIEIDLQNAFDEKNGRYKFLSGQYGSARVDVK